MRNGTENALPANFSETTFSLRIGDGRNTAYVPKVCLVKARVAHCLVLAVHCRLVLHAEDGRLELLF